jgi:hypothetical protein
MPFEKECGSTAQSCRLAADARAERTSAAKPRACPDLDAGLELFTSAAEVADAELEVKAGEDQGLYVNYDFRTPSKIEWLS